MKKVFRGENSTIAHIWANKTQSEATNGSNFYFNGDTIYSYGSHFPIAKHVISDNDKRERAVLFTEQRYSNTTAKQIHIVKHACSHLNIIYCYSPNATHERNFMYWLTQAEAIADNLKKAKKPEKYLNELSLIKSKAEKYADFFEMPLPLQLLEILNIENSNQYAEYLKNKEAILQAELKAREARDRATHKKELKKWLNSEIRILYSRDGRDYLRINPFENEVETTQGVNIPLPSARALWEKIKAGTLKVGDTIKGYEVTEVGKDIKIGCHTFPAPYLIRFGDKHLNNCYH